MALYQIDNRASPVDFETTDPVRRSLQNAKNLLMTRMGEVPYDRTRGMNPELFDLPIAEIRDRMMPEIDRCMRWEPDVSAQSAEATLDENGDLYIKVIVEVGDE